MQRELVCQLCTHGRDRFGELFRLHRLHKVAKRLHLVAGEGEFIVARNEIM